MERRQFLRRSAAAGVVGITGLAAYRELPGRSSNGTPSDGVAGENSTGSGQTARPDDPTSTPEKPPVRHSAEFGTVVNAVQAGADSEGHEPIGELLNRYAADDTLLSFPAGTYLLPPMRLREYDHFGIAAAHDERPTFVAPANSCTNDDPHVKFDQVSDFLLEGIDFDFRQPGAGGAIDVIASGDATVRDVTVQGTCRQQGGMFRIDIRNPEGIGLVERLRLRNIPDGGWIYGTHVGTHHSGEVTFLNCEISEFTDNGLYGSSPGVDGGGGGVVHTVGGTYENNNVANIRLGTAGSTARNNTIVVESAPEAEKVNLRGIRFRRESGQLVEDCDIRFGPDVTDSFGAIVFHSDGGSSRVADSRITMESNDIPAINAFYHSGDGGGPTFENLTIDGDASGGYAIHLIGRDGTTFQNCTVEQPGDRRDGIRIADSDGCELVDSHIDVTGYPLILRDTTMTIRNTTFVTPDGERHVDHMEAEPGDFRPETWE